MKSAAALALFVVAMALIAEDANWLKGAGLVCGAVATWLFFSASADDSAAASRRHTEQESRKDRA